MKCPRGCVLPNGIKRKDLAKHAKICPLEMVQCPFLEAGCTTRILRKDLDAHMESNTQQHLMKMMTAYSKLSSQVANQTFIEPVKLTDDNNSFAFNITLSRGWTSSPFSVLDGYTFNITHKEGKKASLMLLKGKNDDQLKWPMNLQYKLEMLISKPRRTTAQGRRVMTTQRQVCTVKLSNNLERVTSVCSKEIADINLQESELLNCEIVVRLVSVPQPADAVCVPHTCPTRMCPYCFGVIVSTAKFCFICGRLLPSCSDEQEKSN